MSFFIRRFTETPSLEVLTAIETLAVIDRTPRQSAVGVSRTMLLIGEFEDGDFNTPTAVYGESDQETKFGGFGFTYGDSKNQNPCARLHGSEFWNGNAWLKGQYLNKAKIVCRVDTSVGDIRCSLAAALRSSRQTFDLEPAMQLSVTTDAGGPALSTAVAAVTAQVAGGPFAASGFLGGEQIGISIDGLPEVIITFAVGDQTRAQVAAKINAFMGYVCATDDGANMDLEAVQRGTGSRFILRDVSDPGGSATVTAIGHAQGTTNGTGNVANVDAVTAAEAATLINSGAVLAINAIAVADSVTGEVILYRTGSTSGTILVAAGTMATAMEFATATTVTANVGAAFTVPAGTRVRNAGGDEWVTMRTLSWPEGTVLVPNTATQDVEVRPGNDIGTLGGSAPTLVTTLVDYPTSRFIEVTNPAALSAALTEAQIDAAYEAAFDATLNPKAVSKVATEVLCARNSAAVKRVGRQNAIDASDEECYGRHFYARGSLGWTMAQAIADVALWRSDRVFYTWPGWQMYVAEIAALGEAGGVGFTEDGIIDIGADGPLAFINCYLNPEENPGQDTGRLTFVTDFDSGTTEVLTRDSYVALKAAGICAPRVDNQGTPVYQSEATADLTPGRTTQKRRKMADFIQDSIARLMLPYAKKLATDGRRAGILTTADGFLSGLKSAGNPDLQRISDYSIALTTDDVEGAADLGIEWLTIQVRQLHSFDTVVLDTEIGEGVVVVHETA